MEVNRSALSTALGKAVAYKLVGKDSEAKQWGDKLVKMLKEMEII